MEQIVEATKRLRAKSGPASGASRSAAKIFRTKRAADEQNRSLVNAALVKLARNLAVLSLLAIICQVHLGAARAEAAQSEVWSESDGLQVKYSTNHDNMSSSKGSELSLSSDQQNQRHSEQAASEGGGGGGGGGGEASGGESQPAGGAESNEGQTSEGQASEGSSGSGEDSQAASGQQEDGEAGGDQTSEQGASDSRQSEKSILPSSSLRTQSSSSKLQRQLQGDQPSSFRDIPAARPPSGKSSGRTPDSAETFESLGPSLDDISSEAPAASEEQTSADSDSDDSSAAPREGAKGRFRQPGRLFKEAVRLGSDGGDLSGATRPDPDRVVNAADPDDKNEEGGPSVESPADRTDSKPKSVSADDDGDDGSDAANDSGEWGKPKSQRQSSGLMSTPTASKRLQEQPSHDQLNLIDDSRGFGPGPTLGHDQVPANQQDDSQQLYRSLNLAATGGVSPSRSQNEFAAEVDDDFSGAYREQAAAMPQGTPMFYDQSSRSLLAASSQKGLTQSFASSAKSPSAFGALQQQGAANKQQPAKQLAYFRGVTSNRAGGSPKQSTRLQSTAAISNDRSPDSVRDNFISPGHYPGSMPHLTQAASEFATNVQKDSTPAAAGDNNVQKSASGAEVNSDVSEQQMKSSSQGADSELNGKKNVDGKLQEDVSSGQSGRLIEAVPSDTKTPERGANQLDERLAESKQEVVTIAVTPMPELQVESQQIMAPILSATTTMAPMPSTSSAPTASTPNVMAAATATAAQGNGVSTNATTAPTTSTATKASSQLMRFKFRKYR